MQSHDLEINKAIVNETFEFDGVGNEMKDSHEF